MSRRIALGIAILTAVAACGKDDAAGSGQTTKTAARDSVPLAPPATPAPGSAAAAVKGALGDAGTKTAARPPAAGANTTASVELASANQVLTVQVASFLNAGTAQALRARLQRAGVPAWTTTATVGGQEFTRVRVGGATTEAAARAVADKIRATYHWPVWVTKVENRAVLPADVLNATRTYAGGT